MKAARKIAALILAAGRSSRMGSLKPLLPIGRSTALEEAVNRFYEAGIRDVRVVVGYKADRVIPLVECIKAKWVFNESFDEGMLSSILAGIRNLEPDIEAFFLLPVDTPLIKPQTIQECLHSYSKSDALVIYPCFQGLRGHPPLISASCVAELSAGFKGGLRAFLRRFEARAMNVNVIDRGVVMGCNTPEEYREILAYGSKENILSQ